MPVILKGMHIFETMVIPYSLKRKRFMRKYIMVISIMSGILSMALRIWAMDEDEYARMAAISLTMMHEAGGDSRAVKKASQNFLNKFSQEKLQEYTQMAQQVMQDKELGRKMNRKVMRLLEENGYNVKLKIDDESNSIVFEP